MTDVYFEDPATESAFRCIIRLGTLAHSYGVSSYRLQSYLIRVARAVGPDGSFAVTPSSILFVVWTPGEERQNMHFAALSAPAFDLTRLSALSSVIDQDADGSMRITDADDALDQIQHQAAAFGTLPIGIGYTLCGAGFGVLLSLG